MIYVLEMLFCRFRKLHSLLFFRWFRHFLNVSDSVPSFPLELREVVRFVCCQVFDLEDTGIMSRDKFKVQMVGRGSLTERGQ